MPTIDEHEVHKLAKLAHLTLDAKERAEFPEQLERVLDYAERIQELDTEGVEPTSHALLEAGLGPSADSGAVRDDVPRESLDRERVLEGAPDASDGLFKVPKVLP